MKTENRQLFAAALLFHILLASAAFAGLQEQLDGIITGSAQQKVQFSVRVVKADSGKELYSHNARQALVPASNMKIIVTAAALKFLGADYKFTTKVGLIDDTLVVIGSGDPLLGDAVTDAKYGRKTGWVFDKISAALQRKSVGFIKDIIVDTSVFDDQRVHPNWPREQLNRWYACEVCGLNYNGNCVDISAKTVKDKVVISVEPQSSFVEIINKAQPISTGRSTIGSYRQAEPNRIIVFGKCSKTAGPFSVAIERPAAFFGYLLAEHLNRTGIKVKGRLIEKRIDKEGDITLLTEFSHLMKDCLARCNKDSFGLAAEALLKTIAAKSTKSVRTPQEDNRNGSWDKGRTIISGYLRQLGIDGAEFYIDDASGLSRQNRLSARTITQVLLNVYNSQDWGLYERSLAAGGVDGTIEKYFKEPKYKGKILGKTGYIKGVKSFSGICITDKGDYIFSILSNVANGRTRDALNDIAKAIVEFGAKDK